MSDISTIVDWATRVRKEQHQTIVDAMKYAANPAQAKPIINELIEQYVKFSRFTDEHVASAKPAPRTEYAPAPQLQYAA